VYWGGQWHVYYLEVPNEPLRWGLYGIHSADVVSKDLIYWEEHPVFHEDPNQPWWLIANILHEGKFYSFCNGQEGINLSISEDFSHWSAYEKNPVISYRSANVAELRDPSIFKNEGSGEFWLVFAVKKSRSVHSFYSGAFYYSTSKDLLNWSPLQVLYDPGGINVPECPELFQMGKHYYLLGSWGTDRVGKGRYRIAESPKGPWRFAETDSMDGTDIPAPNTASNGDRRLFFGWIPTYSGNSDSGRSEWGGHLAFPREIYAAEDGSLYSRAPAELEILRDRVLYPQGQASIDRKIGQWTIEDDRWLLPTQSDFGEIWLDGRYSRLEMSCQVSLGENCSDAGFIFRAGDPHFSGYEVAIDYKHQMLILREHLERRKTLAFQSIDISANRPMQLRVFVDGSAIEAFLDDRFSLAGRAYRTSSTDKIGFYSTRGDFEVSDAKVYALKEIYPASEAAPVNLGLRPDPRYSGGQCIAFPVLGANVYCDYSPSLNFTGSFTLECWTKTTPGTSRRKRNLIVKGDGRSPGYHYGLNLMRDNSLEFYFKSPEGFRGATSASGTLAEESEWVHVAGVLDTERNEIRLYKNGQRIAEATGVQEHLDSSNEGSFRLGCGSGLPGADPFLGLLDEVRIWNCARTDREIQTFYKQTLSPEEQEALVIYWNAESMKQAGNEDDYRWYMPNLVSRHPELRARLFDGAEIFPESPFSTPTQNRNKD